MIDWFVKDWKMYELVNHGYSYPERLSNGYWIYRNETINLNLPDLITQRTKDTYRVFIEVQR